MQRRERRTAYGTWGWTILLTLILLPRIVLLNVYFDNIPDIVFPDTYSHFLKAYAILDGYELPLIGMCIVQKLHLGPLSFYLTSAVAALSRDTRFVSTCLEVLFLASVYIFFFAARRYFGPAAAILAATGFAYDRFSWELITRVTNLTFLPIFMISYFYFAFRTFDEKNGERFLVPAFLFLGLSMQLHATTWVFLPAFVFLLLLFRPRIGATRLFGACIVLAIPFAPWLFREFSSGFPETRALLSYTTSGAPYLTAPPRPLTFDWNVFLLPFRNFQTAHPWAASIMTLGMVAGLAALFRAVVAKKKRKRLGNPARGLIFCAIHLALYSGMIFCFQLKHDVAFGSHRSYFWYAVTPFAYMLIGHGLTLPFRWLSKGFRPEPRTRIVPLLAAGMSGIIGLLYGAVFFSQAIESYRNFEFENHHYRIEYDYAEFVLSEVEYACDDLSQKDPNPAFFTLFVTPSPREDYHLFSVFTLMTILKSRGIPYSPPSDPGSHRSPAVLAGRIPKAAFSAIFRSGTNPIYSIEDAEFYGPSEYPFFLHWHLPDFVTFIARYSTIQEYRRWKSEVAPILESLMESEKKGMILWEDVDNGYGRPFSASLLHGQDVDPTKAAVEDYLRREGLKKSIDEGENR